jgi:hypothetical protein
VRLPLCPDGDEMRENGIGIAPALESLAESWPSIDFSAVDFDAARPSGSKAPGPLSLARYRRGNARCLRAAACEDAIRLACGAKGFILVLEINNNGGTDHVR